MMEKLEQDLPLDDGFRAKPFIRTRQQPAAPHLWRWEICSESTRLPRQSSAFVYRSAHDAWEAAHAVLETIFQNIARQRQKRTVAELVNSRR